MLLGEHITGEYTWLPDLKHVGEKALVAALYDKDGAFLAGSAIPVKMAV